MKLIKTLSVFATIAWISLGINFLWPVFGGNLSDSLDHICAIDGAQKAQNLEGKLEEFGLNAHTNFDCGEFKKQVIQSALIQGVVLFAGLVTAVFGLTGGSRRSTLWLFASAAIFLVPHGWRIVGGPSGIAEIYSVMFALATEFHQKALLWWFEITIPLIFLASFLTASALGMLAVVKKRGQKSV